ncbi:IS5/IS1182 family transposase, partial [Xanthomonas oryzae pv. oryzae]
GWAKLIGTIGQVMVRGLEKVDQVFMVNMTAYNLVRMRTLGQMCLQAGETALKGQKIRSNRLKSSNQGHAPVTSWSIFQAL